jgi:hypothetical protein
MDRRMNQLAPKIFFLVIMLLFAVFGKTGGFNSTTSINQDMIYITIDFQDGFVNDSIECRLNGKIIYSKNNCNTSQLTGLADSVRVKPDEGLNKLKVSIVSRGIEKDILIEVKKDVYVGISIVNDTIEHIVSAKPFGYG